MLLAAKKIRVIKSEDRQKRRQTDGESYDRDESTGPPLGSGKGDEHRFVPVIKGWIEDLRRHKENERELIGKL